MCRGISFTTYDVTDNGRFPVSPKLAPGEIFVCSHIKFCLKFQTSEREVEKCEWLHVVESITSCKKFSKHFPFLISLPLPALLEISLPPSLLSLLASPVPLQPHAFLGSRSPALLHIENDGNLMSVVQFEINRDSDNQWAGV